MVWNNEIIHFKRRGILSRMAFSIPTVQVIFLHLPSLQNCEVVGSGLNRGMTTHFSSLIASKDHSSHEKSCLNQRIDGDPKHEEVFLYRA